MTLLCLPYKFNRLGSQLICLMLLSHQVLSMEERLQRLLRGGGPIPINALDSVDEKDPENDQHPENDQQQVVLINPKIRPIKVDPQYFRLCYREASADKTVKTTILLTENEAPEGTKRSTWQIQEVTYSAIVPDTECRRYEPRFSNLVMDSKTVKVEGDEIRWISADGVKDECTGVTRKGMDHYIMENERYPHDFEHFKEYIMSKGAAPNDVIYDNLKTGDYISFLSTPELGKNRKIGRILVREDDTKVVDKWVYEKSPELKLGERVTIEGLQNQSRYNGQKGTLITEDKRCIYTTDKRWFVQLDIGEVLSAKKCNLRTNICLLGTLKETVLGGVTWDGVTAKWENQRIQLLKKNEKKYTVNQGNTLFWNATLDTVFELEPKSD